MKGQSEARGTIKIVDATHVDITWDGFGVDRCLYARAGDYVILCGNRDKAAPTEFKSGPEKGGLYLDALKKSR